ncbi:MAG: DUF2599 domain-containing protein [Mycolicibacterium sp.]|jgi:hypothetical protein|nr:DUF2599 domain-containing protein [Mycolicibacterium sp.]
MRIAAVVLTAGLALAALVSPAQAGADVDIAPPYIDHTEWTSWDGKASLRVYPTPAGRAAATAPGGSLLTGEAWSEVLALQPDADTAGMADQFSCHWHWAEFAEPGKSSWNLEPWRPVVTGSQMLAAHCNPGGPEERL